jgi:hypothetical protein
MRGRHHGGEAVGQLRWHQKQRATAAGGPLRVVVDEALRSEFVQPLNRSTGCSSVSFPAAVLGHLLAAPAVAERDRACTLGGIMPHDVLVKLGRFPRRVIRTLRTFSPNDTTAVIGRPCHFYRAQSSWHARCARFGSVRYGASNCAQLPGCAGVAEIAPPLGMHWLGGSAVLVST